MDEGQDAVEIVVRVLRDMLAAYKKPRLSSDELFQRLERRGLTESVTRLRPYLGELPADATS
jgi:hypothetical protein